MATGTEDDEFLTKERFAEQMSDGSLYTGLINTYFISNNIMQNYKFHFENGLLKNFYYVTPTSDEWGLPGVG